MALTALAATKAQPQEKPYKLADKDGLYLQVNPNGKKYWRFKYRFLGKEKLLAVGVFPEVSLAEARDTVIEARKLLRQGTDPSAKRKEEKREALNSAENTFYLVAKDWHSKHLKKWTKAHAAAIWRRLELHIMPHLGQRPINQIKPLELLDVIRKIENKGATEMSRRVLQSCSAVFTYALILEKVEYNPAASLSRNVLQSHKVNHFPALKEQDLPEFLAKLDSVDTTPINKLAIKLLLHTFVRQGEMRQATWAEIDWDKKEWRIPPAHTKMREEHIVPLSSQALAILRELYKHTGHYHGQYLFPSQHRQKNPIMSENTVNSVLKKMGYQGRMVGHGFRALASTTLNEKGFRVDVIERQLAHKERNSVRAAYNRAEYLEERRDMMQQWGDILTEYKTIPC